jgi:hypothetical protein
VQKLLGFFLGGGGDGFLFAEGSAPRGPLPAFNLVAGLRGGSNGLGARLLGLSGGAPSLGRTREQLQLARELAPVLRELAPQMRQYGLQVVGRLTDRVASRVLRFAREQLLGPDRYQSANASR